MPTNIIQQQFLGKLLSNTTLPNITVSTPSTIQSVNFNIHPLFPWIYKPHSSIDEYTSIPNKHGFSRKEETSMAIITMVIITLTNPILPIDDGNVSKNDIEMVYRNRILSHLLVLQQRIKEALVYGVQSQIGLRMMDGCHGGLLQI
jgi:hypothetical protein